MELDLASLRHFVFKYVLHQEIIINISALNAHIVECMALFNSGKKVNLISQRDAH